MLISFNKPWGVLCQFSDHSGGTVPHPTLADFITIPAVYPAGMVKKAANFDGATINTIDGIRADWPDGWGLVRGSNTTPILVLRFDAETEEALERIKTAFRSQMLGVKPDLQLPF